MNFQITKSVLINKFIQFNSHKQNTIEHILMYEFEAGTIKNRSQKNLEASEMWFRMRMLQIS